MIALSKKEGRAPFSITTLQLGPGSQLRPDCPEGERESAARRPQSCTRPPSPARDDEVLIVQTQFGLGTVVAGEAATVGE